MEDFKPQKGSAVTIPVSGIVQEYREKYSSLVKDTSRKFRHMVYIVRPQNDIIVHVKVPSESIKTEPFYYDVLIQLMPGEGAISFRDCDVRVFSNCPSYVYSGLGYIHSHWNAEESGDRTPSMMIDSLRGKLPRENLLVKGSERRLGYQATHKEPVVRNPMGLPIFDKSLYYAVFYMEDNLTLPQVRSSRYYVAQNQVVSSVASFDHLMVERKRAERRERERKNRNKQQTNKIFQEHEKIVDKDNKRSNGMHRPRSASTMKTAQSLTTRRPKSPSAPKSTRR